jgi:hypothetical protein
MRTHAITIITTALVAMSIPSHLSAQREHGGSRPGIGASRPTHALQPMIPREPVARPSPHEAPLIEADHPRTSVPYVRDEHWYGHAAPDDARFHLPQPFAHGRFALTGRAHLYSISRFDLGARHIWLPGGEFEIADWDWDVTAPWCWDCDQFVVYVDPDHPGWYLLYDVRMGEYVHAEFMGV